MVYVGSKNRIAPYICPILQEVIDNYNVKTYIEPFVGGANVLDKIKCENRIGYDRSKTLIALFNKGLTSPEDIPTDCSLELFNKARSIYRGLSNETMEDWMIGAIQYFGSFGTKGFKGGFASPKGNRYYYKERYNNFIKQLPALKEYHTEFYVANYKDIDISRGGCLIYCDPPYEGTITYGYSFENDFDHNDYWNWVREISVNNYVLCSEQKCPDDFEIIWSGNIKRLVSAKNDYCSEEILCTYKKGLYNERN